MHSVLKQLSLLSLKNNSVVSTTIRTAFQFIKVPHGDESYRSNRRIVHHPLNDRYTTKPLKITKLGGRDPLTGRVMANCIGGGRPQKFRWIDFYRRGPADGSALVEKVIALRYDPLRTTTLATVASGSIKRYLAATENMKVGDLISTSSVIPRNAVRPREGDSHPLGALPLGTVVHYVEQRPGKGAHYALTAGTCCVLSQKIGENVVIELPSKHTVLLSKECQATVGRLSNVGHKDEHIGSAARQRWLGNRPHSGLWQRKTGRFGRKLRKLPPMKDYSSPDNTVKREKITLNLPIEVVHLGQKLP